MLKGLDPLLDADLLYLLAAMGHGDEVAVVDRNFPAVELARRLVRLSGVGTGPVATAILSVFPLDTFVEAPLVRMEVVGDPDALPAIQVEVLEAARQSEGRPVQMGSLERMAFYERARRAFGVVATGEDRGYGCFLLVKGGVPGRAPSE